MAKKGAKGHRVPSWLRKKLEVAEKVALRAAIQLGTSTHAANNHEVETVINGDKTIKKKFRDNDPTQKQP